MNLMQTRSKFQKDIFLGYKQLGLKVYIEKRTKLNKTLVREGVQFRQRWHTDQRAGKEVQRWTHRCDQLSSQCG